MNLLPITLITAHIRIFFFLHNVSVLEAVKTHNSEIERHDAHPWVSVDREGSATGISCPHVQESQDNMMKLIDASNVLHSNKYLL